MSNFGDLGGSGPSDRKPSDAPSTLATGATFEEDLMASLKRGEAPAGVRSRLQGVRAGTTPWTATLTPAELMIVRSHGLQPIAAVSATCWLHYGYSWTRGHSEGWSSALRRLKDEARAAGANAVLDVKLRTIPLGDGNSMDFTLIGTAVFVEGFPPSDDPIVATIPALEFVKLVEADVVPTGIAVGANFELLAGIGMPWSGNIESERLSELWQRVRDQAHQELRRNAGSQGNGVLAHVNFSQSVKVPQDPPLFLARHIVVATTIDARRGKPLPHEFTMALDLHAGRTPLSGGARHDQSYPSNESEGAI